LQVKTSILLGRPAFCGFLAASELHNRHRGCGCLASKVGARGLRSQRVSAGLSARQPCYKAPRDRGRRIGHSTGTRNYRTAPRPPFGPMWPDPALFLSWRCRFGLACVGTIYGPCAEPIRGCALPGL